MLKLQLEQGSPEWHEFRKNHIGASDAPIIMNLSPWTTPYQLWRQKQDLDPSQFETDRMRRGKELEPFARMVLEESLNQELYPVVLISNENEWMSASLDAMSNDGKTVVEIKCPGKEDHLQSLNNVVPEKYVPQLQHQMYVCELDSMYYFSFDGEQGKLLQVYRDDIYIKYMLSLEEIFWDQVKTLTPPPISPRDHIEKKDEEWDKFSYEWKTINFQLKELENKEKKVREYLIKLANNQSCKGNGVSLTKIVGKGRIKYEEVPIPKEIDLEKYRGPAIESWRIGVN